MSLGRNVTQSEWDAWAEGRTLSRGGDEGVLGVRLELDIPAAGGQARYLVPFVRIGNSCGIAMDSRAVRSMLRRSLEALDQVEDIFAEVAEVRVWLDGECPCGFCSGRGHDGGRKCNPCGGKGVR